MRTLSSPFLRCLGLACLALLLQSCATPEVADYADQAPRLKLREFFDGRVVAHGIFTKRSGEVAKRFRVEINSRWETIGGIPTGTLDESFTYSDGTTQKRVWTIREVRPDEYVGTAADVVGQATGRAAGNALNWRYTLALPVDGTVHEVQFDDWMFLVDPHVMLNRASMRKFGIELGQVTLSFHKP